MKKTFTLISICLLAILFGCKTKELTPEQQTKAKEYAEKIENRNFTFHATSAQPMSARSVNLNYDYYLKVTSDTIIANLPYFGRSYIAPINPRDISIDFTSTKFNYSDILKKDGTYEIKIEPLDITNRENEGISLLLRISPSGYGTLNALPTNRQSISFYGTVD
ncbi:uncharacterized protein DUF4251 [Dysgonomonas alginatilytica]|uniref:Uncharacterized protein DUF4251 n=1 Tax=Dysgonomonas alginatilytica TaxID=1605892 RepID=A0A2V3PP45_9BACT|nr:DUF4251 domain-containing protein [Dysgonomonas alginatilytica]PXV63014.1 uncharacterized protein DUF4251 [Dysgonomonas alginatilytica]